MKTINSEKLFKRALKVMPGGNTRHTVFFDPYPVYAASAEGCMVTDVEGVRRIDFNNNFSALIHGHAHPEITALMQAQLSTLCAVGLPTEAEVNLAELLCDRVPSIEHIRFVNSGTEAVMLAVKLARAFTGRAKIAKVEGCYHGTYDTAETSQSPVPELWGPANKPASVGHCHATPCETTRNVIVLPFNDLEASRAILEQQSEQLAGILIDTLPAHLFYTPIEADYLQMLRDFTQANGSLLMFDEVYTGRLAYQGRQGSLNVLPDVTVLGKIIGGGFPVGAVGGKKEVMDVFEHINHAPKIPHGGTFNANPMTMTAGFETMKRLQQSDYDHLTLLGERLREGIRSILAQLDLPLWVTGEGSLTAVIMSKSPPGNYRDLYASPKNQCFLKKLHRYLLNKGILSDTECHFVISTAMSEKEIDYLIEVLNDGLRQINA